MLTSLRVRDLAVLEDVEVVFAEGLTVLTGETGAGKSLVVDALTLLAGGRADPALVRAGAAPAEAGPVEEGRAGSCEFVVRREIATGARGRGRVIGTGAALKTMQEI